LNRLLAEVKQLRKKKPEDERKKEEKKGDADKRGGVATSEICEKRNPYTGTVSLKRRERKREA